MSPSSGENKQNETTTQMVFWSEDYIVLGVIYGFAIITWNNPKQLETPCITKGLATYQFLGLIFSCNKVIMLDTDLQSTILKNTFLTARFLNFQK